MVVRKNIRTVRRNYEGVLLGSLLISLAAIAFILIKNSQNKLRLKSPEIQQKIVAEYEMVKVPVPVEVVAAGTFGREIPLRMVNYPAYQLPDNVIRDPAIISAMTNTVALPAGLPILKDNFIEGDANANAVVDQIPDGMRAMTIKVDATSAVEGWAGSGSIVDVLLIEPTKTTVIAEKVKILSAERSVAPVNGSTSPSIPNTVTLLVTQEQCLAINAAIPLGRIAFALRNSRDHAHWTNHSFSLKKERENLFNSQPTKSENPITGFVSYDDRGQKHTYALSEGKWTKAIGLNNNFRLPKPENNDLVNKINN